MIAWIFPRLMPSAVSVLAPGVMAAVIAVDLPVGTQVQLRIEQVPVKPLQWQSFLTAFVDDLQQGFGCLHYAYLAFLLLIVGHLCHLAL